MEYINDPVEPFEYRLNQIATQYKIEILEKQVVTLQNDLKKVYDKNIDLLQRVKLLLDSLQAHPIEQMVDIENDPPLSNSPV